MDLQSLRIKIDKIDDAIVDLFQKRMDISGEVALYKIENNLPVFDPVREQQKLQEISGKVHKGMEDYITALYSLIFELSRSEQERIINSSQEEQ